MAVWVVHAGEEGAEEHIALINRLVTIHWNALPDLSDVKSREDLEALYTRTYPEENQYQVGACVPQVWGFCSEIKEGDLVIIPLCWWTESGKGGKKQAIALGHVTGTYVYRTDLGKEVRHTIPVEWLCTDLLRKRLARDLSDSLNQPKTVSQIKTPSDAEDRFRAAISDEIERRYQRVRRSPPAVEASKNVILRISPTRFLNLDHFDEVHFHEWPDMPADHPDNDTGKPVKAGCRLVFDSVHRDPTEPGKIIQVALKDDEARRILELLRHISTGKEDLPKQMPPAGSEAN